MEAEGVAVRRAEVLSVGVVLDVFEDGDEVMRAGVVKQDLMRKQGARKRMICMSTFRSSSVEGV